MLRFWRPAIQTVRADRVRPGDRIQTWHRPGPDGPWLRVRHIEDYTKSDTSPGRTVYLWTSGDGGPHATMCYPADPISMRRRFR